MSEESSHATPLPEAPRFNLAQQQRLLVIIAVAVAGLIALVLAVQSLLTPRPAPAPVLPPDTFVPTPQQLASLKIEPVGYGSNAEIVRASGLISVDADHSTPILLPYSGQVAKVFVEPGQHVVAGQPLLSVASTDLVDARNALLTAAAQVSTAREAARVAQQNADRQKAIYETAGGAFKDYNQAQADLIAAQATLRTAQSALRAAQDRLRLFGKSNGEISSLEGASGTAHAATLFRAPVGGTIADRNVAPGQFVTAGGTSPLLTIADLSHVWLIAQLAESEAAKVQLGDEIAVTTPAFPGREFHARVDNIGASLDPVTHRLSVRATVDNPGALLKPQMFASFSIRRKVSGPAGVLVPAAAVIHEGDNARVWVLGSDKLIHARPVTIGETESGATRVTSGLRPGDRIVTAGALFVNEAGLTQ